MSKPLIILTLVLSWIVANASLSADAQPPSKEGHSTSEEPAAVESSPPRLLERKPPARDFPVRHTLSVTDFGARPDDGKDDLPGIRAAMSKAAGLKEPTAVLLPKGTYDLFLPEDPDEDLIYRTTRDCLAFFQASEIIFDGQGSTMMIHQPTLGFLSLLSCNDIVVRNFTVEWKTPPFAQGFVRGIDHEGGWIEFEETPGFLSLDAPSWQEENRKNYEPIRWGMLKDRKTPGRMKAGVSNFIRIRHWEKTGLHRYRLFPKDQDRLQDFEVGDPYVHVDRNGGGLCRFTLCRRVVFDNITNYTSPGLDYGGAHSSEIGIFNCKVLIKPGYWHTSNADGMHFSQHRIGPWVEGCTFEGMADDGANLYAHPINVAGVISDKEFDIGLTHDWRPGDLILGFEPTQGEVLGRARVVSASIDKNAGTTHLTIDRSIPRMTVGEPMDRDATYFLNLSLSSSNFVFRDNTFHNVRRFGILIQSHDGIVENNTFEGISSSSINVRNSASWPEGFATGNIVIRGNTIGDSNFDQSIGGYNSGDISVHVRRLDGRNGSSRAISQVEISGNTIVNTGRRAINVASATDVQIVDNVIRCQDPTVPVYRDKAGDKAVTPIHLCDVDRVTVAGNTVIEPRNVTPGGVVIEGECTAVEVRNNRLGKSSDVGRP